MQRHELSLTHIASKTVESVRTCYEARFGSESGPGIYGPADWARIDFVASLIAASVEDIRSGIGNSALRMLDVGIGGGQFINVIQRSGLFAEVHGLDILWHSKLIRLEPAISLHQLSLDSMAFDDDSFDHVVCMEVLEHLDAETFSRGLAELRRVVRRKLIVTVPFDEPEPIPAFHKQRFTEEDLDKLFPGGDMTLLVKPNYRACPWALIVEDHASSAMPQEMA